MAWPCQTPRFFSTGRRRGTADRPQASLDRRARARSIGGHARFPSPEAPARHRHPPVDRSEEHTSELQSLMRISYAVFCLKKKIKTQTQHPEYQSITYHTM